MTDSYIGGPVPGVGAWDGALEELDRFCAEVARDFREPGMAIDRDPDDVGGIADLPGIVFAQLALFPPDYQVGGEFPADLLRTAATSRGSVIMLERLAYGDPNVILAGPGPSMSGNVVRALADDAQARWYFNRLAERREHTFFGLTEPGKGSAAGELTCTLTPAPDGDGWLLNGEKRYIGNGARAQLGVVFARRSPGPWGIEAVLVDTAVPGFSGGLLPMMGLRGARISWLRFEDVRIPADHLLGAHLPPTRRGIRGAMQTFYRFRPGIAAMALGSAQAACDHVRARRPLLPMAGQRRMTDMLDRIAAVRSLMHQVAADIDHGLIDSHRIGAVKVQAAHVAEEATLLAADLLGPGSLIEDRWLEKTYRDVRAFELMEGTTNLHRMSVLQGLRKNTFLSSDDHWLDATG
jgi:alkylation response protein AidB-like acyl-CoA dehydrogenase